MSEEKIIEILEDFTLFAKHFLKIRTKSGKIVPLVLNHSQTYILSRIYAQLKETGKVRALILKGRQQGCSTLILAWFFFLVVTACGKMAFILTHLAEATKNLFDITKRYYDSCPEGLLPKADTSSAKSLSFKTLNSGYSVGTAGNKAVGRSQTIQLMLASEVGYYPHAEEHAKGILQAVSNEPGTQIIMESTANGVGNYFHDMWLAAQGGESEFQAIFIPWYWQDEYTADVTAETTNEEEELLRRHQENGLTKPHLFWRRKKLLEFSNDFETGRDLFNVEYPTTPTDAFRNSVDDPFIKARIVSRCLNTGVVSNSPLIIGVDPACGSVDRLAIIRRRGRLAEKLETHINLNTMSIVGLVRRIIDAEKPVKVFIDCIGLGDGVVDRLKEVGYDCVEAVNVARNANEIEKFSNVRAELWYTMREWMCQEAPVQIPDNNILIGDLSSIGYTFDSDGRWLLKPKKELTKSPDTADALSMTFARGEYLSTSSYKPYVALHSLS